MADSPFDSPHVMFLLFGCTHDLFCLADTRLVTLTEYLQLHLRSLGFKEIAFHHPRRGVRVIGVPSECVPVNIKMLAANTRMTGKTVVNGPLNQLTLLLARRPDPPPPAVELPALGLRTFPRMSDSELPSFVGTFFAGEGRRALIFEDFEYVQADFHPDSGHHLRQHLRDLLHARSEAGIVIFISALLNIKKFEPDSNEHRFQYSLEDRFFHSNGFPRSNVICIGAPNEDEVLSFQRRLRLRYFTPTNFQSLSRNCSYLAAEFRSRTDLTTSCLKNNQNVLKDYDWMADANTDSAIERLAALPGRAAVAERVHSDIKYAQYEAKKFGGQKCGSIVRDASAVERLLGQPDGASRPKINLNYAFAGRPGTGKTIIARLIGEAFKEAGVLRSGHVIEATVPDLVGEYLGQTALKATELLGRARGGVLFIDEVQSFERDNDFHREAIRTVLKYVEDYRGDISVIIATYPSALDSFLLMDEGLPRRFPHRIYLEDYDAKTCVEIFKYIAAEKRVSIDSGFLETLESAFDAWKNDRQAQCRFDNAGSVRNLLEGMDRIRVATDSIEAPLRLAHVPKEYEEYMSRAERAQLPDRRLEDALEELEALPGLREVKKKIREIVTSVKAQRLRGVKGATAPGHYSFEGSPGTGKTSVARLLGNVFRELGVLKSGHIVETRRSSLVGQYLGETGQKVERIAEKAMDGILFIDEAHSLLGGERDSYGQQAIEALTPILENERHRLCVILAGYTEPMERLFAVDPGWKSRIPNRIRFADYEPEDMAKVLRLICGQRGLSLDSHLDHELLHILSHLREKEGANFANGRSVRNLVEVMNTKLDERLVADPQGTDYHQLTLADVPTTLLGVR